MTRRTTELRRSVDEQEQVDDQRRAAREDYFLHLAERVDPDVLAGDQMWQ